jgi:hypothetical protein
VTIRTINSILDRLDDLKKRFDPDAFSATEKALTGLARQKFNDAETLVRYHELLLFLRAYPSHSLIVTLTEKQLTSFPRRLEALRAAEVDISPMEIPEISGIAGTSVTDTFTYPIVRWLVRRQRRRVGLEWDWFEDENRLAATWPRFMPLLEEDALVEANVPYQTWLRAANANPARGLTWLIERFASLSKSENKSEKEIAELYDSQKLYVRWTPPYRATRTGMRIPVGLIYFHRGPLIQRRDVSLQDELEKPPAPLLRLSVKQGEAILDIAREASTTRYRELYGFTHGDPRRVFKSNIGRGVDIFIVGLPPQRRLPLRAYHAAMIFKNGVPVGYFEGLSLFERMESGFNLYYTFRDGETAWLYARTLSIFRHLLGVTAFTLDPYQIGYENEEGIESGAFWFYRKLGFRPTDPDVMKLVRNEEKKMATRPGYRTSAQTLRKLARASMIFELKSNDRTTSGDWDRFQVRNIGLAVARLMARKFGGDNNRMQIVSVQLLTRLLGIRTEGWQEAELTALNHFAEMLMAVGDLPRWSQDEKQGLLKVIRARAAGDESTYLKLMQKHALLRSAMIKLGSQ